MNEGRDIIAKSPAFLSALEMARKVADSCSNVLITGESGSGKEVIAQYIHDLSQRKNKSFVAMNCAAIPEALLESELFGYSRGAFTGAAGSKVGLFEEAEGGTLFLDEIADLDFTLQAKLLRVLQERKIKRLGENTLRPVNIRIIAATHENLNQAVQNKKFREDLYFRLNVITIHIPSLRHRTEDIAPMAEHFARKFARLNGKFFEGFSPEALEFLHQQAWPGNVRELENCIERAVVLSNSSHIQVHDLHREEQSHHNVPNFFEKEYLASQKVLPIDEMNRRYIEYVLQLNKGAKEKTARDLGIDRKTLYRKLQETKSTP